MSSSDEKDRPHAIILFDGICNLCNSSVDFIIRRDNHDSFRFASLQSEVGKRLATDHEVDTGSTDSIVLIDRGQTYIRSTAALRIARGLSGAWPILYGFIIVPRPLRDLIYKWIARNRYKWFGKKETCRLPTPEEQALFL